MFPILCKSLVWNNRVLTMIRSVCLMILPNLSELLVHWQSLVFPRKICKTLVDKQFWIFFFKNMFDSLSLDCFWPQFWTVVDRGRLRLFGKYFAKLFHNIWQNNFTICFTGCCDVAPGCTSVGHDIAHLSKIAKWHLILYRMRLVDHPSGVMEPTATTSQMLAKYVAKPNMQQTHLTFVDLALWNRQRAS